MRQRPDETWQIGVAMWRTRPLATQILLCVLAILLVTSAAGAVLYANLTDKTLDGEYKQRATDIAYTVAQIPAIADALAHKDPDHRIQALAEQVRKNTSASYVVVADRDGVRYSHPTLSLIGQRLEEPVVALDGNVHTGIDPGSLGNSANAKVPLRASDGAIIGEVSVGIPEERVSSQISTQIMDIALYSLLALGIGVLASWLLARALKRVTFGLELSEIATLLQEREAMLHGIREGVVGIDAKGCVNVINDEARRLLGIRRAGTGRPVSELLPAGRLRDLLADGPLGSDEVVVTDDFLLVVNRMPVVLAGRPGGHVVTLRDRTELEGLMRELHALTGLTNALRAQEHEFTNRLHVLSGLLGLGEIDEAARYLAEVAGGATAQAGDIQARIAPAELAALLVAKVTTAAESGVRLILDPESELDRPYGETGPLLTVLGNLIDNAVDAAAGAAQPGTVTVRITDIDDVAHVVVSDTGPGISQPDIEKIFLDGYSTKSTRDGMRRGLGLALVRRLVVRAGGTIDVTPGPGARFDIRLPLHTNELEAAK
ncbi:sensor histidine kinase [Kutzneria buriramensis]|uniref:histidine kinase n=1 Tax=Kutzneria buriramensis TaxID=1045776 RepID=A0A3E0H7F9_9PSEU|nr:sensor histidine kinase [Kutzneria buriramensis]REH39353.1 two-component system CitB family sensor kinase [Kutzneria buriramensis]